MKKITDFTVFALRKIVTEEKASGNIFRAQLTSTLIDMYKEDKVDVVWECGEPIFKVAEHHLKSVNHESAESKDEKD